MLLICFLSKAAVTSLASFIDQGIMGNWQLEVFRMAMYISFPVAVFHYFNQPENFEEYVIQQKSKPRGLISKADEDSYRKMVEQRRQQEQLERIEQMEKELKAKHNVQ